MSSANFDPISMVSHWPVGLVQGMIQAVCPNPEALGAATVHKKTVHGENGEESDEEAGEEEDPDQEVCDLIVRLRRTPSGNNWEHSGLALQEQHAEIPAEM